MPVIWLIIGLILILVGANMLTDGASAVAKRWGVSDLVVGLTVVAFGTSAPELAISVVSAINGNAGLAIGNVVGSNIFNVLVIIGVTALCSPIRIDRSIMTTDIPMVILSALALLAIGNSSLLDGTAAPVVGRVDGILLLLFFAIFLRRTFASAKDGTADDPAATDGASKKPMPLWKSLVWIAGGLAGLVYGGDRFVAAKHFATEKREFRIVGDSEVTRYGFGKYLVNLFGLQLYEAFIVVVNNGAVFLIFQIGGVRVNFAVVDSVLPEKFFETGMSADDTHTTDLAKWRGYKSAVACSS